MNLRHAQEDLKLIKEQITRLKEKIDNNLDITQSTNNNNIEEEKDEISPIASDPDEIKQNNYNENI